MTLFEIGTDLEALAALLDESASEHDGEISSECDAQLTAWFAELTTDLNAKADNYAALIRERLCRAAARKEEAERMAKLASADENLARQLKERLKWFMERQGMKKIETERYRISVRGNGGIQKMKVLVQIADLPTDYQKQVTVEDTERIRKDLEAGKSLAFAELLPRGSNLQIN